MSFRRWQLLPFLRQQRLPMTLFIRKHNLYVSFSLWYNKLSNLNDVKLFNISYITVRLSPLIILGMQFVIYQYHKSRFPYKTVLIFSFTLFVVINPAQVVSIWWMIRMCLFDSHSNGCYWLGDAKTKDMSIHVISSFILQVGFCSFR